MRHHPTPVRTVINNKSNACWPVLRKGNPCALLLGLQTGAATAENSVEIPQKRLKIDLPCNPPVLLLGIHLKKPQTLI